MKRIPFLSSSARFGAGALLLLAVPLFAQQKRPDPVALPQPASAAPVPSRPAEDLPVEPPLPKLEASAPVKAPAAAAATRTDGIRLNFQGASLTDVLNYLSDAAGFVIVQEAPVTGTVNVVSRQPVTPEEAVDLLNAVLIEKGYVAIRSGRILKIVNRKDAQKRDLPVATGSDPEKIPRKDEMVTQILPLRFGEAGKLLENLKPLLSDSATISANEGSNTLLLTDTQTNIRRVAQIIQAIDTSVSSISTIRVFPLTFADSKEVATIITQLFATGQTSQTGNNNNNNRGGRGGFGPNGGGGFGPGGSGNAQPTAAPSEARLAASRVVAVADEQSNAVIVSAPDEVLPTIKDMIMQLDQSITAITETRIFRLLNADAVELAQIITTLHDDTATGTTNAQNQNQNRRNQQPQQGGQNAQSSAQSTRALRQSKVVAVGDPRTNSLVVTAARDTLMEIAETVGRLDATDAKRQRVYVHSLEHADADSVAAVLRGMLGDTSGNTSAQTTSRLTERTSTGAAMDSSSVSGSSSSGSARSNAR